MLHSPWEPESLRELVACLAQALLCSVILSLILLVGHGEQEALLRLGFVGMVPAHEAYLVLRAFAVVALAMEAADGLWRWCLYLRHGRGDEGWGGGGPEGFDDPGPIPPSVDWDAFCSDLERHISERSPAPCA